MGKPLSLTLLYSANIAGDLALLPRLYTFLRQLQPRSANIPCCLTWADRAAPISPTAARPAAARP